MKLHSILEWETSKVVWAGALAAIFATSSCNTNVEVCEGPPGLYIDSRCTVLAPDLLAYTPAFPLWSDGAEKERFIRLPEGSVIDARDADDWVFPVGTTLYKNFSVDGQRVETRVLEKVRDGIGVDAWEMRTYAWDREALRAFDVSSDNDTAERAALRTDALGTHHDIPTTSMCRQCHSAAHDVVNGFSAIQLSEGALGTTLPDLVSTHRIDIDADDVRDADIPGTPIERAAIGYMHANCAHCHRDSAASLCGVEGCCRTPACLTGLHLWVRISDVSVIDTDAYQTGVGVAALNQRTGSSCRVAPGHSNESVLVQRMAVRGAPAAMPRIGSEQVDAAGLGDLRTWIDAMPAGESVCVR